VSRQDIAQFADAIGQVASSPPTAAACRRNAERFSVERFIDELRSWVDRHS
jgi:hypothetical protein